MSSYLSILAFSPTRHEPLVRQRNWPASRFLLSRTGESNGGLLLEFAIVSL